MNFVNDSFNREQPPDTLPAFQYYCMRRSEFCNP